ncbi:c-type cytochrome [Ferruginibacter yonginensis]|uniref:C-type cytochrome n=1 Tax=Ferruginibacter yonginensis TaxID=1310416 RepID=A0ABV8QS66_9BACT
MKKLNFIVTILVVATVVFASCDSKRQPGKIYMPDMAYSRAYESYGGRDTTKFTTIESKRGGNVIFYNNIPPHGTIKRGELFPYTIPNDSAGYKLSASVKNPYDSIPMSKKDMEEAGRLYNINCAICHGAKGVANGPIATGGYVGGVANLTADAYVKMTDGTMFHSITYGRGVMGSYASQVSRQQRWMIIKYIRTLQPKPEAAAAPAAKDSTAAKKI